RLSYHITEFEEMQRRQIGAAFRKMRVDLKLNTRDMASKLGTSQYQVSTVEHGKSDVKFSTFQLWAKHLGYSLGVTLEPLTEGEPVKVAGSGVPEVEKVVIKTQGNVRRTLRKPARRVVKPAPKKV